MKIDLWGNRFVDDNDHFAEYDVDDSYGKLIVTLINKLNVLDGDICKFSRGNKWGKINFLRALNEYLNYNIQYYDDFIIKNRMIDISCGDIKMPISILKSLNPNCQHRMIVVGKPGEIHYLLWDNMTLSDCVKYNQGLISFSMKSGEELAFAKNYINSRDYIKELYFPGSRISAEIFDLDYLINNFKTGDKKVCSHSAFDYPEFFNYAALKENICVTENEKGIYEIDIRDCDGRPHHKEIREGETAYSVYYQYMVEKGYFADKPLTKIKK